MAKDVEELLANEPGAMDQEVEDFSKDESEEQPLEIPSVTKDEDEVEEEEPQEIVNASEYKCFNCGKIISEDYIRKKVRCPYCGSKIIFKARTKPNEVVAR